LGGRSGFAVGVFWGRCSPRTFGTRPDSLDDLADGRAKIEAARAALEAVQDEETVRQAVARLDRMIADLERADDAVISSTLTWASPES
jgi:hypothetical protein